MKNTEDHPPAAFRQRRFLIITGILELVLLIPGLLLAAILGVKGYAVGEMGIMLGFFSTAALFLLLPYTVVRALAVHGLRKKKRFGPITTIVLLLLLAAAVCSGIKDFPVFTVAVFIYVGFSTWAAIVCLRSPDFEKHTRT